MTRAAALLDAALTVQGWQRQGKCTGIAKQVAADLGCHRTWPAIEAEIVRRLLAEDAVPMRQAA